MSEPKKGGFKIKQKPKIETAEVIIAEERPAHPAQHIATTPDQWLAIAIERGRPLDELSRLMDLHDRWKADKAKSEYMTAKAKFQKEVPRILKATNVNFEAKKEGGREVDYNYADLGDIGEAIKEPLHNSGLSYDWDLDNISKPGKIIVTCIVSHVGGYEKRVKLEADLDTSGGKNAIQANGSTITYLERYTLNAALGLTSMNPDDDGRKSTAKAEKVNQLPPIGDQFNNVIKQISEKKITIEEVCKHYTITFEQMKALTIAEKNANTTKNSDATN